MPRGVPNVKGTTGGPTSIQRYGGEVLVGGNAGPWDDQPQGEAAEQARTGIPEPVTEPDQSDRVIDALLLHLAALNSKARKVGADRDDLFLAESFAELVDAVIEDRARVRP